MRETGEEGRHGELESEYNPLSEQKKIKQKRKCSFLSGKPSAREIT